MVLSDIPPELLTKTIPELLTTLVTAELSKPVADWIKEKIRNEWDKKKYGFTPDPETAAALQKVIKKDAYKRIRECIGAKSPCLKVIRLGLLIEDWSYADTGEKIKNLRSEVHSEYGKKGISILNMGNVGALVAVINHLSQLKIDYDYSQEYLHDYFQNLVTDWNQRTIFHQSEHGSDELTRKIIGYMDRRIEIFFVFGIGSAGDQAAKVIASINNQKIIQIKGYTMRLISEKKDILDRIHYAWIFDITNICSFDKITL